MRIVTGTSATRYTASSVCSVRYSPWNAAGYGRNRCSGTNTSLATIVLLPVPFMPTMNHVSSIVSWLMGINERPKLATSPSSLFMWMPQAPHWACNDPDAQGHRPLTRHPPSTGVATPLGASDPAAHASGFDSQMSLCARSGKSDASHAHTLIRLATQDVDPQPHP